MATRTHVGIRAVFICKHYRGEVGAVLCNRSEEDLPVKLGDPIDQLILAQIGTPDVKEVTSLDGTVWDNRAFPNVGSGKESQNEDKCPSRISVVQHLQGKPQIRTAANALMRRQFIFVKTNEKVN